MLNIAAAFNRQIFIMYYMHNNSHHAVILGEGNLPFCRSKLDFPAVQVNHTSFDIVNSGLHKALQNGSHSLSPEY